MDKCDEELKFHGWHWRCKLPQEHHGKHVSESGKTEWLIEGNDTTVFQNDRPVAGISITTYPALKDVKL